MSRKTLNLGILAHVDAGKTTLTERLLYAAGVIDAVGSVDHGTTQTDSLDLERQRGITIKSAVAAFSVGDVKVNLIDTPGHPDFIAEVERVLSVLDGAVLVISAVEGVQPQTRLLMRALKRLSIPTLFFVNKIDRAGASEERVLEAIRDRLTPAVVPMGSTRRLGDRAAEFVPAQADDAAFRVQLAEQLAENDEAIFAGYVEDETRVPYRQLWQALAEQTKRSLIHPVYFGSAITGAGIEPLEAGITRLLPAAAGDGDGPVTASVFKIERANAGEKIAYIRIFSGTVRTRDRLQFGDGLDGKVKAIAVFNEGAARQQPYVSAGEIAKLWGLGEIRIGDRIGEQQRVEMEHHFPPPTLESVVVARDRDDRARLHAALAQLAEQDPLIDVRRDDTQQENSVSLYGEVQKEVIEATLARDFGIEVSFRDTTTIYVERPLGIGEAVVLLQAESNPFLATVGLRVEPAPLRSGIEFTTQVSIDAVPLYVYKNGSRFSESMANHVCRTLQEGLFGWQVTDCRVTLTDCDYSAPGTTAADFRKLTPLVLMRALAAAGTCVCEPMMRARVEAPTRALGLLLPALGRLGGPVETPSLRGQLAIVETLLPSARVHDLQRQMPGLTSGEGVLETEFAGYRPLGSEPPTRRRTTPNPLNFDEYMLHLTRRVSTQ